MSRPSFPDSKHPSWSRDKSPTWDRQRQIDEPYGRSSGKSSEGRSHSRSRGRSRNDRDSSWYDADPKNQDGEQMFRGKHGGTRDSRERQKRRRSASSNSSSGSSRSDRREPKDTNPKYKNARLFVANIVSKEINGPELKRHFERYGHIADLFIHTKNFAFIQYTKEEHALLAIEGEQDRTLKGWKLDVKMACEDRKAPIPGGGRGGRGDGRGERGGRGGGRFDSSERDRSPIRDDRIREPYMEPFRGGSGARPPFPPGGDFGPRDPYLPDPFRRGFQEPWVDDDSYRRDPYAEPYRDSFRQRAPQPLPPPVIECEIFVNSSQFRAYGEAIERRVKEQNIITAVSVMPEGKTPQQMVEDLTTQSCLFAIFINPQNEMHRSLTLNILHGTPQEHRNMPLDDAIALVGRSFIKYVDGLREKAQAASAPLPSSSTRIFLPPSSEVTYLLNLLADNRTLTILELDVVIKYLQERRSKLADAESRPIFTDDNFVTAQTPLPQRLDTARTPIMENTPTNNQAVPSTHQDFTSKILSLFSSAGGSIQGVPPANGTQQPPAPKLPSGTPAPPPPAQASVPSSASLINFDNPNVQKALDNLIQSTPNLLKNIGAKAPLNASQMGGGPIGGGMYGQNLGQVHNNQNQAMLSGVYGAQQGQLMQALGQGMHGSSHSPSLQSIYNMSGQGMQEHMQQGYGPPSQSRY